VVLATDKLVSVCARHHSLVAHAATALVVLVLLATTLVVFVLFVLSDLLRLAEMPNVLFALTNVKSVVVQLVEPVIDKLVSVYARHLSLVAHAATALDVSELLVTTLENPSEEILALSNALFALIAVKNAVDLLVVFATDKREIANV